MIKVIKDFKAFSGLKEEWNNLADKACTPLLSHEWFFLCAQAFYSESDLYIIVLLANGNIDGIAPLVVKNNPSKRLEIIGASFMHEPSGLLYNSRKSLEKLCTAIVDARIPLSLSRINIDSQVSELYDRCFLKNGIYKKILSSSAPYISISSDWDKYIKTLSSRRRYDLRRARKCLDKIGNVEVEYLSPNLECLEPLLSEAFQIEASSWKEQHNSSILSNDAMCNFLTEYSNRACRKGILRLVFLKLDSQRIAMQIGIEYGGSYWILKIGYNEKWAKCSPGIVLMTETLRRTFNHNLHTCEFLGSNEKWLQAWKPEKHNYTTIIYYPYNINGAVAFFFDALNFVNCRLKRIYSK